MEYSAMPGENGRIQYVECAPDYWLPENVEANGPAPGLEDESESMGAFGQGFSVRARYELHPYAVHYLLVGVDLYIRRDTSVQVSARFALDTVNYRSLKLEAMQSGLAEAVARKDADLDESVDAWIALPRKDLASNPDEELMAAARAYVKGAVSGRRPHKTIAEELGVSIATAGRRAKAAMEAGYLPTVFFGVEHAEEG